MYTGITRGTFRVVEVVPGPSRIDLVVELSDELSRGLTPGASVSIDGVCLTAVSIAGPRVSFQAVEETLRLTTLGELRAGAKVSVERSLRAGDEIGGHELAGHVSGTGTIAESIARGDGLDLRVTVPAEWMKFVLPKGFIAVDGSSLTVGETDPSGWFWLHLIPETLRLTNFGHKRVGDRVNIELDARTVAIVSTVERVLAERFPSSH
jgi:riboflavin synthase